MLAGNHESRFFCIYFVRRSSFLVATRATTATTSSGGYTLVSSGMSPPGPEVAFSPRPRRRSNKSQVPTLCKGQPYPTLKMQIVFPNINSLV